MSLKKNTRTEKTEKSDEKAEAVSQQEILNYVVRYFVTHGRGPTMEEIGAAHGLKSSSSPAHHVRKLESLGYLEAQGSGRTGVYPTEDGKRYVLGQAPSCPLCNAPQGARQPDHLVNLDIYRRGTRADVLPWVNVERLRPQPEAAFPVVAICDLEWDYGLVFRDVKVCEYDEQRRWLEFPHGVTFGTTGDSNKWQAAGLLAIDKVRARQNRGRPTK